MCLKDKIFCEYVGHMIKNKINDQEKKKTYTTVESKDYVKMHNYIFK